MLSLSRAIATLLLCAGLHASAQTTETRIFDPAFKTLKVEVNGNFMAQPVVSLGGPDQICVSFDEMGDDRSYLRCSLLHCDSDWQPSDLLESEVLDSFNEMDIDDFGFSAGVFRHYVNYRICIPNDVMRPLVARGRPGHPGTPGPFLGMRGRGEGQRPGLVHHRQGGERYLATAVPANQH